MVLVLFFLCLAADFVAGQKACPSVAGSPKYAAPVVAKGFTARVVISGLTRPRGMIFDSEGNLLVVQNRKEITAFRMTNAGGCVKTAGQRTVLPAAMGQGENVCPYASELNGQALKFDAVESRYPTYSRWQNLVCVNGR
jgi:glucose/arabinose dehydrogenase